MHHHSCCFAHRTCILLAFLRTILCTPCLGDLKSSKGAIPLVFVVPERLALVWYSHLPVFAVSS